MKRMFLFVFVMCTLFSNTICAQNLLGDMNHNGGIDVGDITLLIDDYLTSESEEIPYTIDNSLIVGRWYLTADDYLNFYEDGTSDAFDDIHYTFYVIDDEGILVFSKYGIPLYVFHVPTFTDGCLVLENLSTEESFTLTRCFIELSEEELTLAEGDQIQLTADVVPEDAGTVYWRSNTPGVARVSRTGLVTAVSEGTAIITAEVAGVQATCTVTVKGGQKVTAITLSQTDVTLEMGYSYQMGATVTPSNATNKSVKWSTSDASVVTVRSDGLLTTQGVGTAIITCEAADGSGVKATCMVTVTGVQKVTAITLSQTDVTLEMGYSYQMGATVTPSNATNKSVKWSTSDASVVTVDHNGLLTTQGVGTATITCAATDGSGVKATCTVAVKIYNHGHEYVDLGLSVKWATMNIGANSPEDYGDYFAWGETTSKDSYSWETYKWCKGFYNTLTKYCTYSGYDYGTVDNKSVLVLSDDAARYNWGGTWRMPTYDELNELKTKCTTTWTSLNGVKGRLVTGPNGNSIFLPAAGHRYYSSLYDAGSIGYYWSSSLDTSDPIDGKYLVFYSSNFYMDYNHRFFGQSVRAVCP